MVRAPAILHFSLTQETAFALLYYFGRWHLKAHSLALPATSACSLRWSLHCRGLSCANCCHYCPWCTQSFRWYSSRFSPFDYVHHNLNCCSMLLSSSSSCLEQYNWWYRSVAVLSHVVSAPTSIRCSFHVLRTIFSHWYITQRSYAVWEPS